MPILLARGAYILDFHQPLRTSDASSIRDSGAVIQLSQRKDALIKRRHFADSVVS